MGKTEKTPQSPVKEIPLASASWIAQELAKSPFIAADGEMPKIHVYQNSLLKDQEFIEAKLLVSGWNVGDDDRHEISLSVHYDWSYDADLGRRQPYVHFSVQLPQIYQTPDMISFAEEFSDGWHARVEELLEQGYDVSPIVNNEKASRDEDCEHGPDSVLVSALYPRTFEKQNHDQTIGMWYMYDAKLPKYTEEQSAFIKNIVSAMSRTYKSVTDYADWFLENEVPYLVSKRDERVKTKPPGWLVKGIATYQHKNLSQSWQLPAVGTEPNTHQISAELQTEAGDCNLMASSGNPEIQWSKLTMTICFPESVQNIFNKDPDRFAEAYQRFLTKGKNPRLFEPIQPIDKKNPSWTDMGLRLITYADEHDEIIGYNIGVGCNFSLFELLDNKSGPKTLQDGFHEFIKRWDGINKEMQEFLKTYK
jgi:hypothetical protein